MTSDSIAVDVEERTIVGKGLAALRHDGMVPGVIHNHGKESIHVMGEQVAMSKVFAAAGKHHPVQVKLGGKQHLVLIKHADFEPTKHRLRHLVFQAIRQNEEVTAEIPLIFAEDVEIPAEKVSLLVLKQLTVVEVKALPRDLPDQLVVDPSSLVAEGDHLTVADIQVPKGVTIMADPEIQIAIVEVPADQVAAADAAAADLAADAVASGGAEEATEASAETTEEKAEEA